MVMKRRKASRLYEPHLPMTMTRARTSILTIFCILSLAIHAQDICSHVDPRIGSEGVGRTFPGPSMPFGMVKPGPDCGVRPNAGWAPMPEPVTGFSQTHVSGTGGGQKYGNILIQPMEEGGPQEQKRTGEKEQPHCKRHCYEFGHERIYAYLMHVTPLEKGRQSAFPRCRP